MPTISHIVSQPIDLEMAMFYVNTFFMIMSAQIGHLFYTLYNEKGGYNEK